MNSAAFQPEGGQLTSRVQTGKSFHICSKASPSTGGDTWNPPRQRRLHLRSSSGSGSSSNRTHYGRPATAYCRKAAAAVVTVAAAAASVISRAVAAAPAYSMTSRAATAIWHSSVAASISSSCSVKNCSLAAGHMITGHVGAAPKRPKRRPKA